MFEKRDIMVEILHELNPFDPIREPETSDIMLIFAINVFSCPHNYHKYYNKVQFIEAYSYNFAQEHDIHVSNTAMGQRVTEIAVHNGSSHKPLCLLNSFLLNVELSLSVTEQ